MAYLSPLFIPPGSGGMLVGADNGRIDHGVFIIGILRQGLENLPPRPILAPARMPRVNGPEVSEPFWQIAPCNSGSIAV